MLPGFWVCREVSPQLICAFLMVFLEADRRGEGEGFSRHLGAQNKRPRNNNSKNKSPPTDFRKELKQQPPPPYFSHCLCETQSGNQIKAPRYCHLNPLQKSEGRAFIWGGAIIRAPNSKTNKPFFFVLVPKTPFYKCRRQPKLAKNAVCGFLF